MVELQKSNSGFVLVPSRVTASQCRKISLYVEISQLRYWVKLLIQISIGILEKSHFQIKSNSFKSYT